MAGRFARVETRRRARGFLLGLLADLPRKNCWTIAEHAGDPDPHGMQHLLARASWDTDGVRDDLRDYVTTHLGDTDAKPDAALDWPEGATEQLHRGHLRPTPAPPPVPRPYRTPAQSDLLQALGMIECLQNPSAVRGNNGNLGGSEGVRVTNDEVEGAA
jgi:hypothetical protein